MKTLYFFTLTLIAFPVFAKAFGSSEQETFIFESLNKTQSVYEYRVNMFSDFFGKALFNDDALFIFYEKDGLQSLFVFKSNQNSAIVYRLPRIPFFPWLNPERYIKERKNFLKKDYLVESCHQSLELNSNEFSNLKALKMEKHAHLINRSPIRNRSGLSKFNHVIMGFLQQQGKRQFFYFETFGGFGRKMPKAFDAYTKSFDIIENISKRIALEECR